MPLSVFGFGAAVTLALTAVLVLMPAMSSLTAGLRRPMFWDLAVAADGVLSRTAPLPADSACSAIAERGLMRFVG